MTLNRCTTPTNLDANTDSKRSEFETKFEELVFLFRTLLESFLEGVFSSYTLRHLPPVNIDGRPIDFCKLFLCVSHRGGFDTVSQNEAWGEIAAELGFNNSDYVKLIYKKYLDSLARWLNRETAGDRMDLSRISDDLIGRLEGFVAEVKKLYELKKGEAAKEFGGELKWFLSKTKRRCDKSQIGEESGSNDAMKETQRSEMTEKRPEKMMILDSSNQEYSSPGKRKRECHLQTLQWLLEVAKDPCDPDRSNLESYAREESCKELLLFRASRTNSGSACEKNWQKLKHMHPSLYTDSAGPRYNLRTRVVSDGNQSNAKKSGKGTTSAGDGSDSQSSDDEHGGYSLGPEYQAELPEWTDDIDLESDTKLLGTKIWPPSQEQNNNNQDPVGKGREEACCCQNPGSVECIRSHITTEQEKLKLELGPAFYIWQFDNMGESSLRYWTELEVERIKSVMNLPPTLKQLSKILTTKSRKQILNYFYNVVLLEFRANQNRVSPDEIGSDTDNAVEAVDDEDPNPDSETSQELS